MSYRTPGGSPKTKETGHGSREQLEQVLLVINPNGNWILAEASNQDMWSITNPNNLAIAENKLVVVAVLPKYERSGVIKDVVADVQPLKLKVDKTNDVKGLYGLIEPSLVKPDPKMHIYPFAGQTVVYAPLDLNPDELVTRYIFEDSEAAWAWIVSRLAADEPLTYQGRNVNFPEETKRRLRAFVDVDGLGKLHEDIQNAYQRLETAKTGYRDVVLQVKGLLEEELEDQRSKWQSEEEEHRQRIKDLDKELSERREEVEQAITAMRKKMEEELRQLKEELESRHGKWRDKEEEHQQRIEDLVKDLDKRRREVEQEIAAKREELEEKLQRRENDFENDLRRKYEEAEKHIAEDTQFIRLRKLEEWRHSGLRKICLPPPDPDLSRKRSDLLASERKPFQGEIEALDYAYQKISDSGRDIDLEQLIALHVSLKLSPFTVLAGPSGTGKTSLLRAYTEAMGIHATLVPVQPNWTSVDDLHGYFNPIKKTYEATPFYNALKYQDEKVDNFLDLVILDEINLSYVEYFLADYLSAFEMPESEREVRLGGQTVILPTTFLIAGTANEDHTTQPFSDKFRDRVAFMEIYPPEEPNLGENGSINSERYITRERWRLWCKGKDNEECEWRSDWWNRQMEDSIDAWIKAISKHLQGLPTSHRTFKSLREFVWHAAPLLGKLRTVDSESDAIEKAKDWAMATRLVHRYKVMMSSQGLRVRDIIRQKLPPLLKGKYGVSQRLWKLHRDATSPDE